MFRILVLIVGLFAFLSSASAALKAPNLKSIPSEQTATKIVQVTGKKLIAPSAAARIAQGASPSSKLLNVRLSGGGTPRYVVKARKRGKLHIIVIDAKTGTVVRR